MYFKTYSVVIQNDSKKIGCFFVEINDLAEDLRYKPLDFEDESDK